MSILSDGRLGALAPRGVGNLSRPELKVGDGGWGSRVVDELDTLDGRRGL